MQRETRSIVALLSSVFVGSTAMALLSTVLGKLVFDMTGSELALGLLGLAEFAPAALLVFVTGTVADRVDRRRLAAIALTAEAATVVGIAVVREHRTHLDPADLPAGDRVRHPRAFAMPATRSLPADTVAPARLPWLTRASRHLAGRARPRSGARRVPLRGGSWVPFAAAAGSSSRPSPCSGSDPTVHAHLVADVEKERPSLHEAVEGLRFVRSQPILLGAISLDLFAVLFGGAVALLPAIAEDRLGVGAVGLGWLRAATGIGAGVVAFWLALRPVSRRIGRTLLVAVALFGVGTIVLGVTTSFAVAFVALLVLSGADAVSVFIRSTLVPLVTPADKRGRVLAVEAVFIGASNELGAFESGVVGQLLGPAAAVVLGGVATLAVAALWWHSSPPCARSTPSPRSSTTRCPPRPAGYDGAGP